VNVERLLTATDEDGRRRELYVTEVQSFEDWRAVLNEQSLPKQGNDGFALLLVADATDVDGRTVADLADWCIENGLFSVSVWGPGCERVHDIFDEEDVELRFDAGKRDAPYEAVVMSTWHEHESLAEAIEYFWICTFADDGRAWGPAWIALVVASKEWATQVRTLATTELAEL
jgi:hypothetical protein